MSVIRCEIPSNSVEWSDPNGKPGRKDFEMENYIMLDGRKFEIDEKSSLLLRAVVGEEKRREESCFSQACDNPYYFITSCGSVDVIIDSNSFTDDIRYRVGNYCADKNLMSQRALHEALNRLLWRFSEENGGDNDWSGTISDLRSFLGEANIRGYEIIAMTEAVYGYVSCYTVLYRS